MKEHQPSPEATKTSYTQLSAGFEAVLSTTSFSVVEGFPDRRFGKVLVDSDPNAKALIVHPWTAPKQRAGVILHEAVRRVTDTEHRRKVGKKVELPPRAWVVETAVAEHHGLKTRAEDQLQEKLTAREKTIDKRFTSAVEKAGTEPIPVFEAPAVDAHLEADYDDRQSGDLDGE